MSLSIYRFEYVAQVQLQNGAKNEASSSFLGSNASGGLVLLGGAEEIYAGWDIWTTAAIPCSQRKSSGK